MEAFTLLPIHTFYSYFGDASLVCRHCKEVLLDPIRVGFHYFRLSTGRGRTAMHWDYLIIRRRRVRHAVYDAIGHYLRPSRCENCSNQFSVYLPFARVFVVPTSCIQICKNGAVGVPNEYTDMNIP